MISLIKKSILTINKEGIGAFFIKVRGYLRKAERDDYARWIEKNTLTAERAEEIKKEITGFQYRPKISIIMPVYNVDQTWLERAINSALNQLYGNWELCITDDGSTKDYLKEILRKYSNQDKRIRVSYLPDNKGIVCASNEALSLATGEFIGLLDNDDELSMDALYEVVKLLNERRETDFIYSDEDKITEKGVRYDPFFKPDWSPDTLHCCNYITHFAVVRRNIANDLGAFREGYDGSQDYDLFLRVTEKTKNIVHIPKVLYHWRCIEGSAAKDSEAKLYAYDSAKRALADHIQRFGLDGEVVNGESVGTYRVKYLTNNCPEVSILIQNEDNVGALRRCINSIFHLTSYENYSIIVIDNGSVDPETLRYYDSLSDNRKVSISEHKNEIGLSAINASIDKADSEYMIFLDNRTEVITPDWIAAMIEICQRRDVGAVGALLFYSNDTIQHAGLIIDIEDGGGYYPKYIRRDSHGYFRRMKIIQNLSAVSTACMMTKKTIFKEVGGFDEYFSPAFNDVDYCLKIREKGYLVVYTPYAELYRHESKNIGYKDNSEKRRKFINEQENIYGKWRHLMSNGDPYFNPNLKFYREDITIR
jgi:glycosyltransferase involved in cell wall biosynthesis